MLAIFNLNPIHLILFLLVAFVIVQFIAKPLTQIVCYIGAAILAFYLVFVWTAVDYDQGLKLSERLSPDTYQTVMGNLEKWDDFRGLSAEEDVPADPIS